MLKEEKEVFTPDVVAKKVKAGLSKGRGTLVLAILGIAVSLASSFMFCLASIGFDFTQLTQTVFWSRWASMSISSLCTYVFVILHKDEVNRLNPWYLEKTKLLAEKSESAGKDFEEYLKEINLQRRIEWYKRKISGKIGKLHRKLQHLELKNKSTQKVKEQIGKYEYFVSEEYIEKNKYVLRTRSKPITSAQVLSETQKGDGGEMNFRSASAYYGGKTAVKLALSLAMTAAFACVVVQNFAIGINIASVVMAVLTVLSVFMSVLSAIFAANGCYKNIYVPNLLFKLEIISDFEEWKTKKDGV